MTESFRVKEVFASLQGEGANAGASAVFVRFAGCNLWRGKEATREEDALAHGAECPRWCDTDFVGGKRWSRYSLVDRVVDVSRRFDGSPELIVFTGGEPAIQIDVPLVDEVKARFPGTMVCLETNGTLPLADALYAKLDWITVSPKTSPDRIKIIRGDELKVVFPGVNPLEYDGVEVGARFQRWYVQPLALPAQAVDVRSIGLAAQFCMDHPRWRLGIQLHKLVGLP